MKILLISEYFYPHLAGGEVSLWKICNGLVNNGHKISVITSRIENTKGHEVINGIEIYRPFSSSNSMVKRIWFLIRLYSYLNAFLKNKEIDIIYNLGYVPTLPATCVASKYKIPIVTSIECLLGNKWFESTNIFSAFFNFFMEMFIIRFGKHDVLRFPSESTKKMAAPYTKSEAAVIYNPIDAEEIKKIKSSTGTKKVRKSLGIDEDELFLLFVGSLLPVKNVTGLVDVISKLKKKFKLVLVGEGPERRKIEKLIEEVNLDGKAILVGKKQYDETLSILYSCDLLIQPSKSETFSNVVFEGISLGKPVISTKVGAAPEINSKNLYLIDNLEEINDLLEGGIEAKGEDNILEEYSMDKIINDFEGLFKKTINEKR